MTRASDATTSADSHPAGGMAVELKNVDNAVRVEVLTFMEEDNHPKECDRIMTIQKMRDDGFVLYKCAQ